MNYICHWETTNIKDYFRTGSGSDEDERQNRAGSPKSSGDESHSAKQKPRKIISSSESEQSDGEKSKTSERLIVKLFILRHDSSN